MTDPELYESELIEARSEGFDSVKDRNAYLHWLAVRNEVEASEDHAEDIYSSFYVDLGKVLDVAKNERDWFARGAIEGAPMMLFVGPEKSGKSWIMGDLLVATTLGLKWLAQFQVERPGRVLYLDSEYGPPEFARRIARLARGRAVDPKRVTAKIDYHYSTDLILEKNNTALRKILKDVRKENYSLIVLDPLRNHLDGSENESHIVNVAFQVLNQLRTAARCPLVILHHLNKLGGFAGSRAITARNDLLFEGSDTDQPIYTTKGRTLRAHTDQIAQPFSIEIEHVGDDNEAQAMTRLRWCPAGSFRSDPADLTPRDRKILEYLRKQQDAKTNAYIAKAIGDKHERVSERLDHLVDLGMVELCEHAVTYRGRAYDGYRARIEQ